MESGGRGGQARLRAAVPSQAPLVKLASSFLSLLFSASSS